MLVVTTCPIRKKAPKRDHAAEARTITQSVTGDHCNGQRTWYLLWCDYFQQEDLALAVIGKRADASGGSHFRVKINLRGFPTKTARFQRLADARRWTRDTESGL
ncbi:MAG: hypothetical protein ACI9DC_005226 [Gammaproteobacteria bacterium]